MINVWGDICDNLWSDLLWFAFKCLQRLRCWRPGPQLMGLLKVESSGRGPNGRKWGCWGHALEGDTRTLTPSFLSLYPCFLATRGWTALLPHGIPTMVFCLAIGPNSMGPTAHGRKLVKPWAEINLSSLKVVRLRYLVMVMESWLM
jgi:hypothetical protein